MTKPTTSRAVLRQVDPGNWGTCLGCDSSIKFVAKERLMQIICNVYVDGKWSRVESYHPECYEQAGQPYGPPDTSKVTVSNASRLSKVHLLEPDFEEEAEVIVQLLEG